VRAIVADANLGIRLDSTLGEFVAAATAWSDRLDPFREPRTEAAESGPSKKIGPERDAEAS